MDASKTIKRLVAVVAIAISFWLSMRELDRDLGKACREMIARNEKQVLATLLSCHMAQQDFRRAGGQYGTLAELAEVSARAGAEGRDRGYTVPRSLALSGDRRPHQGFRFVDVTPAEGSLRDGYAIAAVPAEHGETARRTFIMGTSGEIFSQDRGAGASPPEAMPRAPAESGWRPEPFGGIAGAR